MEKILSLIGPGDIEFHYSKLLGIDKERFLLEIEEITKPIVESGWSIELLPDKGVSFEIAKIYKKLNGKKIIGTVPKDDKTFGTKHLEEYENAEVENKKVFDEIINSGDWFKQDMIKGLFGNAVLYLGSSPGTEGELNYATYLFKLIQGMKKFVEAPAEKIHPRIIAGKEIPYTYFIYKPFLKTGKLSFETEEYLKKIGINFIYIENPKQLKDELSKIGL